MADKINVGKGIGMMQDVVKLLRCPECGAESLRFEGAISARLLCERCNFAGDQIDGFYSLISESDRQSYSWLEKLNREDRPEYHDVDAKIYDKDQYMKSGYLDRLYKEISPSNDDVVLDIGCGRGQISDPLVRFVREVISIDLVPENLREVENVNKILGTADNLPVASNCIDLVICTDLLEHLPPAIEKKVLEEIYRVLKPGGRSLISYPGNNLPNLTGVHILNAVIYLMRFFDKNVRYLSATEPPAHINMSYPWRISSSFKKAGFRGRIRPYTNKFLSLPARYVWLAKFLNIPIIRLFFVHQMHGLLRKPK